MRLNMCRTESGSREWAVSSGELNRGRSLRNSRRATLAEAAARLPERPGGGESGKAQAERRHLHGQAGDGEAK